jgi:cytochrome c-type protein NapC
MAISYETSKHAGNNQFGIKARCADCHLPHDNAATYLLTKAQKGVVDVWRQLTYDEGNPTNWVEKRKHRHEYVFDSGCIRCHSGKATGDDPSHPSYFAGGDSPFKGQGQFRCVDCHFYVGHSDASAWLRTSAK